MPTERLTLLDDAVAQLRSAVARFRKQTTKSPAVQSLQEAANAIREYYIFAEKSLKHALASVDPFLLLADIKPPLVRALIRETRASGVSSIWGSRQQYRTLSLEAAWEAVEDVMPPPLLPEQLSQLRSAITSLVRYRHMAQHGELWLSATELLGALERLLSLTRPLLMRVVPDVEATLERASPDTLVSLRAIEQRVDEGWLRLVDSVASGVTPDFELKFLTALADPDAAPQWTSFGYSPTSSTLLFQVSVPRATASGLFLTSITHDEAEARAEQRGADLLVDAIRDDEVSLPDERPTGLLGLLSIPKDPSVLSLERDLQRQLEKRRLAIERFGVTQLEDGHLEAGNVASWATLVPAAGAARAQSFGVTLESLRIQYSANEREGRLHGVAFPSPSSIGTPSAAALWLSGTVWMTLESVVREDMSTDLFPLGAVVRFHRGRARFLPAGEQPNETLAPTAR